ncbi:MAG: GAF domain-containing protein [Firmicutes bacterium]|nr:GAF domain-containing protein [Bacillota bacterium]
MVIENKAMLIEKLTGIHSSKKSYYVELKEKIEEVSKRNIQLEIINQLAKSMGIDMSFREIVENVIPKMQALVYFDYLTLYIVLKDGLINRVIFQTDDKKNNKIQDTFFKNEQLQRSSNSKDEDTGSALWFVLNENKPLLQKNISKKGCTFPEDLKLVKQGITSKILIPLVAKEKVIGVLEVASKREFDSNDLPFLEQVADQLSFCLENIRLYNELWQHKQEWEITFSAVTDLLVFINQDKEIQKVNKAALDFFTMSEKDILGQKCYSLFYGRETPCNPCLGEQVLQEKKSAYQQTRTRHYRVLDIFAYPAFTLKGEPYGVTYYAKDVTRFVDSIKFASLGEMSAGVAHELNSPLTAIVGNSQLLLRETPSSSPHYQLISDIQSCGVRCQRIIQNLLTFSRQDEFSFEEIDLNQVIKKAFSLVSYQIEKDKVDLIQKYDPAPLYITGNSQGLEQIIVNLLLNARDAIEKKNQNEETPEKGEVVISTRIQPEKYVAIDIIDNGCGIDADKIPLIFNPFNTTKKAGKGTGLGLSVSLGIAQAHGGFIDVESIPGKGSTFSLILPLDRQKKINNGTMITANPI